MRLLAKPSLFVRTARLWNASPPRSTSGMVMLVSFGLVMAVIATLLLSSLSPSVSFAASNSSATRDLVLTALPPHLPTSASGQSAFSALAVSMTDLKGNILVATNDTIVYLSSSQTAVLSVPSTVIIRAGMQYALAPVTTTATPGSSVVTAVAPGFESDSATFTTSIATGYPTQLRVYPLPGFFTSGAASSGTYVVTVVDGAGLPARAIQATPLTVTSSDTSVLTVSGASIPLNGTVSYGTMTASGTAGSAAITVSASGLVSYTALVSVADQKGTPNVLAVNSPPTALPADGKTYDVLTISLTNSSVPAIASSDVQVVLTSSRTDIATTPSTVTILKGQSFVTVPVTTTPSSGLTIITASAANFISSSGDVSTDVIPPTRLGIYLADQDGLISKNSNSLDMVVQLQDAQGTPSEARGSVGVIVSFSDSALMKSPLTLTIPKGSDLVYTTIPLVTSSGTFTAVSNGLVSASVQFSASPVSTTHSLTASPAAIEIGQTSVVKFSATFQGQPLSGAQVTWTSTGGTLSQTSTTTNSGGTSSVTFTPTSPGLGMVHVTATSPIAGEINATYYLSVQAPQNTQSTSLIGMLTTFPYLLIWVAVAAVVVLIVLLLIRRRRRAAEAESALSEDEQGFTYYRPSSRPKGATFRAVLPSMNRFEGR
jgi:hypothetical protein